jgi:hypothetical protein
MSIARVPAGELGFDELFGGHPLPRCSCADGTPMLYFKTVALLRLAARRHSSIAAAAITWYFASRQVQVARQQRAIAKQQTETALSPLGNNQIAAPLIEPARMSNVATMIEDEFRAKRRLHGRVTDDIEPLPGKVADHAELEVIRIERRVRDGASLSEGDVHRGGPGLGLQHSK